MIVHMNILISSGLTLLGLVFGSFAAAQVWRLRARQLVIDKQAGEPYDKQEYIKLKPLMGKKQRDDRSRCLDCGHVLRVIDLIPLVSWTFRGGRCRYCKKPIGKFEPVAELVTAGLFVLSYVYWPFGFAHTFDVALFIMWLIMVVLLVVLAAYDTKWQLLPDVVNYSFITAAGVFIVLRFLHAHPAVDLVSVIGSVGILAGIYAVLYAISRGAWIGFGDVKLGIGLGLLLGDWRLAFLALFLANLIGMVIVLPGLLLKRLVGESRIAFGPLLIAGTLIAFWWGYPFIEWLFDKSALLF